MKHFNKDISYELQLETSHLSKFLETDCSSLNIFLQALAWRKWVIKIS